MVPIQVVYVSSSSATSKQTSFPKLFAHVGHNSTLELRQTLISDTTESDAFVASNTHVSVESGAQVTHTYSQELAVSARHIEVLTARVQGDAQYALTTVALGACSSRFNMHTNLSSVGSNFTTHSVMLGEQKQALDMHSSITHDTPSAVSRQQLRIVVGKQRVMFYFILVFGIIWY